MRPICALDTETYGGNIFLIADSDGRYLGRDITAESMIDFLFAKKYQGSWNFFYNLGYDAEEILKLLGDRLNVYSSTRRTVFTYGDYRLRYIPGKCLQIMKGHHSAVFFDIAQYYNRVPLSRAYQDNIGVLEKAYLDFKAKRNQFSPRFYRDHTSQVRNYCIHDCQITKAIAEKWVALFNQAFGFYPARWFSAGYLAEKVLINNGVNFPTFDSIPFPIQDLAFKSYFGGRFEILKRGFIGHANLYDINSAYPHAITKIPDLTDGRWVRGKEIHADAALGFFELEANVPDSKHVPPFPFRVPGIVLFPSGRFRTYVTLAELLAVENEKYYQILESWQFIPNRPDYFPYARFIEGLYEKRLALKQAQNPMQLPIKIILNSIYGKTGQKVERVIGNLFNPVIFAFITGYTRAQLYQFVMDNGLERDVVAFATDSICTTRDLNLKSSRLGEFSIDKSGDDAYYLQNGIYRFNGKWKERGLGSLGGKTIENVETVEKDGRLFLKMNVTRSTRLRSSILRGRIEDIGKIKPVTRLVDLDADRKRFWLGRLQSVNDKVCNDSIPLSLNYFDKAKI